MGFNCLLQVYSKESTESSNSGRGFRGSGILLWVWKFLFYCTKELTVVHGKALPCCSNNWASNYLFRSEVVCMCLDRWEKNIFQILVFDFYTLNYSLEIISQHPNHGVKLLISMAFDEINWIHLCHLIFTMFTEVIVEYRKSESPEAERLRLSWGRGYQGWGWGRGYQALHDHGVGSQLVGRVNYWEIRSFDLCFKSLRRCSSSFHSDLPWS